MESNFKQIVREAFFYLFPSFCIVCNMPVETCYSFRLCKRCRQELLYVRDWEVAEFEKKLPNVDAFLSVFLYAGTFKKLLWLYKEKGMRQVANLFYEHVLNLILSSGFLYPVVSVPSRPARIKKRGFCHTGLLADRLNGYFRYKPGISLVFSDKATNIVSQKELSAEERRKAVEGRFAASAEAVYCEESVILLDDVCTTGSTLNECASVLKTSGVRRVVALTLAIEL
ncbi:phosphoribosyltransferase family protein [Spirochaetia bacterium 38H-sp]|uniref:Phosphoribosyltransferase family protein n=1 Tax=Rarispira pelagica TaxID=3141764 RepID=A0ABU9UAT2_9SPIR